MRSAALVVSALAVGAIAKPLRHQHKRYYVTKLEEEVVTVTKYVTPGYEEPAPTKAAVSSSFVQHHYSHSDKPAPPPSSAYTPPVVVVSTPAYTPPAPAPTPSSAAAPAPPASSSQAAAPSSGGSTSGGYTKAAGLTATSGQDYASAITFFHNVARANHGHDEVQWDESLASVAKQVGDTCKFEHWAPVTGQGQNLLAASGGFGNVAEALFSGWYIGEYANMTGSWNLAQVGNETFEGSGHLTQMVWKDTKKVGCASVDCSGGLLEKKDGAYVRGSYTKFTVCQYSPPGNWANEYANNVGQGKVDIGKDTKVDQCVTEIGTAAKKSY